MSDTPKKILLKGMPITKEAEVHEDITPGMLVERRSDGKIQKHGDEGEDAAPMFAREADFIGRGIDDDYKETDDERCVFLYCRRGDEVYAILDEDSDEVHPGDFLMSKGNGNLTKLDPETQSDDGSDVHTNMIVAVALENIDPSSDERIKVEVL